MIEQVFNGDMAVQAAELGSQSQGGSHLFACDAEAISLTTASVTGADPRNGWHGSVVG